MQTQLNLKTLAAVSLAASTEETRFYLNGVLVQCRADHVMYVATDGHRLIVVREAVDNTSNETGVLTGDFIIPNDVCKAFKIKKRRYEYEEIAILSYVSATELKLQPLGENATIFKPIDGTYPDYRRVIPKELSGKTDYSKLSRDNVGDDFGVTYNPKYLADFAKFGEIMGAGNGRLAYNSDGPAGVIFSDDRILAVLMPMRGDTQPELQASFSRRRAAVLGEPIEAKEPVEATTEETRQAA